MNRWESFIGCDIVSPVTEQVLGQITDIEDDGTETWLTVDDNYQVLASSCEEVIDLTNGDNYIRMKP